MGHADGSAKYHDYADYIVRHERAPGVGLLAGWRGGEGDEHGKGAPNPGQLDAYIANNGFWREEIPEHARYFKMANRGYLEWAQRFGFVVSTAPIVLQLYSEPMQKFRLRSEEHTSELQSLMRISYSALCLKHKIFTIPHTHTTS